MLWLLGQTRILTKIFSHSLLLTAIHKAAKPLMRYIFWILVVALLIAHQDYWQWERNELVFGFMPYTMAYNIGISIATALLWIFVCTFMWPKELDDVQPEVQTLESNGVKK